MTFSELMKKLENKSSIRIWQKETPRGIEWWVIGITECGINGQQEQKQKKKLKDNKRKNKRKNKRRS